MFRSQSSSIMNSFNFLKDLHHPPLLMLIWIFLVALSNIPLTASEIKNIHIVDDSRTMIIFERFGFSQDGRVSISVNSVSWKTKHPEAQLNSSSIGFFLVRDVSYPRVVNESDHSKGFCVLSSRFVKLVLKFENLVADSTYNGSVDVEEPDEYSLVLGNCQPEFEISMHVHTEMYNQQYGEKVFLPAGETHLPKLYFTFFLIYIAVLAIWVFICIKQRSTVDKIHLIMGSLLLVKTLKMICASEDKMYVSKTGSPHGWDIAFYVFGFLKGVMLFTVIVLIGTGWSFLKPYLQEREKKVLMAVVPLQVLENIAYVVMVEEGPTTKEWMTLIHVFLLIDIVCCFAVFFPIAWSVENLREASKTDGKATKNLEKLSLFKQFYIVVVAYLYFTRVVVAAMGSMISYKYEWVTSAVAECASLAFYFFIFYNFQPTEKNPYLAMDDKEELAASLELEEEDSFEL